MPKYFLYPFADTGDKTAVPNTATDDTVNYNQGFTSRYSAAPTDPNSLDVPRYQSNQIYYDITTNLQQYQQYGRPNLISASDNGGSNFPYTQGATALYDLSDGYGIRSWTSLTSSNATVPAFSTSSNWKWVKQQEDWVTIGNAAFGAGVTTGMPVYFDGSVFQPAQANGSVQSNVVGIAQVEQNLVVVAGRWPSGGTSYTAGGVYYLSSSSAGALTTVVQSPQLIQVGVALDSATLLIGINHITSASSFVPTGTIAYWSTQTAPAGWLQCNGAGVSTTTYSALFAVIAYSFGGSGTTFNLPPAGYFYRPWNNLSTGVDPSRTWGSIQTSTNLSHYHGLASRTGGSAGTSSTLRPSGSPLPGSPPDKPMVVGDGVGGIDGYYSTTGNSTYTTWVQTSGGTEARPSNIALMTMIKT